LIEGGATPSKGRRPRRGISTGGNPSNGAWDAAQKCRNIPPMKFSLNKKRVGDPR